MLLVLIDSQFHASFAQTFRASAYKINCFGIDSSSFCKKFRPKAIDSSLVESIAMRCINGMADRGYPFASFHLDSLSALPGGTFAIHGSINTSGVFSVGNVYILSQEKISPHLIYYTTGIFPGAKYCERRIRSADFSISETQLMRTFAPSALEFHPDGTADLYLHIQKLGSNALGASIMLNRSDVSGKNFLTGYAALQLVNNFGCGEQLRLRWDGLAPGSQTLELSSSVPYIFKTPLTVDAGLSLEKTDSLCLSLSFCPVLNFKIDIGYQLSAFADWEILLPSETGRGAEDARIRLYGLGLSHSHKSASLKCESELQAGLGSQRIMGQESALARLQMQMRLRAPISSMLAYELNLDARCIFNSQPMDYHMAFPLGGQRNMRGYAQNSMRATQYAMACNNIRLSAGKQFSVFALIDAAIVRCRSIQQSYSDVPMDFGLGLGTLWNNIRMDLSWAIGCQDKKILPMKSAKVFIITEFVF